jgi:hypothetical protein
MSEIREIWFRRILWGYFPIHWKGLAVLIGGVCVIVPSIFAGLKLADSHSVLSGFFYVFAIGVFLGLFVIFNQHSKP